jgi:hypothetical protein
MRAKNLTLIETIAYRNSNEANTLLINNGYPQSRNIDELIFKLSQFLLKGGDTALQQLSQIHPDKDLIIGNNTAAPQTNNFVPGTGFANSTGYNSCEGCGGKCGGANKPAYSNVDAQAQPVMQLSGNSQMFNTLAIIAIVGIFAMMINSKG